MIESNQFEKNATKIEVKLKETKPSVGRALVNSVIVYEKAKGKGSGTDALEKIKARLDTEFTDSVKLQKRTDKDQKRWVTQKEIASVIKGVKSDVKRLRLHSRQDLSAKEKQLLQLNFILEFYRTNPIRNEIATTIIMPIGRYKQLKEKTKNYLVLSQKKAEIHFFSFKTSNSFQKRGLLPRIFPLNKTQHMALKRWLQHKPQGENLFWRQNGTALKGAPGRDTLGRWLMSSFKKWIGKHVGSNVLRKVYVSELLQGAPSLTALLDAQQKLGHTNHFTTHTYRRMS